MNVPNPDDSSTGAHDTRIGAWVAQIRDESESELGDTLATVFQYLLDNVDAFENGELFPNDLPAFPATEKIYVWTSVAFGTRLAADGAHIHVVTSEDTGFIGAYGIRDHATNRANETTGLSVETIQVQDSDPKAYVEWARSRDEDTMQRLAESLKYIYYHKDTFIDGDIAFDDIPHPNETARQLIEMSVLFGLLWEYSHPSIYGVFNADNTLYGLYANETSAEEHCDNASDNAYVQRVSITDGDLPPDRILSAFD